MLVGYARVSTTHQSLDIQLEQLGGHHVEKIFQEQFEPPRDCRRPFGLSYAATGWSSSMAL